MLAVTLHVSDSGNLPVENSPFRDQPDDLAAGVGADIDDPARTTWHSAGGDGLGEHSSVSLRYLWQILMCPADNLEHSTFDLRHIRQP